MAQRHGAATDRPPRHPGPTGLTISKNPAGSYVHRFKIQRERIKTLHEGDREKAENKIRIDKSLPKLHSYGVQKQHSGVQKFTRSNTIESFKLPGVSSDSSYTEAAKKKPLPVKTFHLKLHPEHTSLMSKSMPSLPSIPGSPSQSQDHNSSPSSDYKASGFPSHGKHRYQKISFQKTLHGDKDNATSPTGGKDVFLKHKEKTMESIYNNVMPQRPVRHRVSVSEPDRDRTNDADSSSVKSSTRSRRSRRMSKESTISDTRSEGGYAMSKSKKKWKDDCNCLRCQMLRRQYKEGDEMYNLWGQYPCHRVDFSIGIDDD